MYEVKIDANTIKAITDVVQQVVQALRDFATALVDALRQFASSFKITVTEEYEKFRVFFEDESPARRPSPTYTRVPLTSWAYYTKPHYYSFKGAYRKERLWRNRG